jgi:outer membrane protein assembly factor BamD
MKPKMIFITLLFLPNLFGCASDPNAETEGWAADRLYSAAKEALQQEDYESAIKYYESLEAHYPLEKFAEKAQLEAIYAYYKSDESESALVAADRFIKLYPRHPHVDYAYYLKGLVNFESNQSALDRFLPLDRSQRDQSRILKSFEDFAELIKRFPHSKYAPDARQRMLYLRNMLAEYELNVAKFYMKKGAYLAAANRAKAVIESYQRTAMVPEALVMLAKSYKIMGLNDLSDSTLRVLKLNYPEYKGIAAVEQLVVKE